MEKEDYSRVTDSKAMGNSGPGRSPSEQRWGLNQGMFLTVNVDLAGFQNRYGPEAALCLLFFPLSKWEC